MAVITVVLLRHLLSTSAMSYTDNNIVTKVSLTHYLHSVRVRACMYMDPNFVASAVSIYTYIYIIIYVHVQ